MSSDLPTYAMGATQLAIGLTSPTRVTPPAFCNGGFFKYVSGGSYAITAGISQLASTGYPVATTEAISISGPGVFYLHAVGATAVVGMVFSYSQGFVST